MQTRVIEKTRNQRLGTQWSYSRGRLLLSTRKLSSGFGESAVVHWVQTDLLDFGDDFRRSDYDPTVVSTVEILAVFGSDDPTSAQEKEARSSGGVPSQ